MSDDRQPAMMPLPPRDGPQLPPSGSQNDPEGHRRRGRIWNRVMLVLFGVPTLGCLLAGSPMVAVWGYLLVFSLGLGALMFWRPRR